MTTRPRRPRPTNRHAALWADLADQVEAIRLAQADTFAACIDTARHGVVSADHARPLITGRTLDATAEINRALVAWEQTLRNEAARLERNGGPR